MLQFCSVSNSLSHTTLSIKWEVYFSKELCPLVFIVSSLWFCMYMYYVAIQHTYLNSNFDPALTACLRIRWLYLLQGNKARPHEKRDVLSKKLDCIWQWGSSSGVMASLEYSFIVLTLRSFLTRSGSACQDPIYKFVWKLFVLDINTWYHITVRELFVIRIVETIIFILRIIIFSNLKPDNCLQAYDY